MLKIINIILRFFLIFKKNNTKKGIKIKNLCIKEPAIASSPKGPANLLLEFNFSNPNISLSKKNCTMISDATNKAHKQKEKKSFLKLIIFFLINYLIIKYKNKNLRYNNDLIKTIFSFGESEKLKFKNYLIIHLVLCKKKE